jgi:hypothetical protein
MLRDIIVTAIMELQTNHNANVAQMVERVHGKDEVSGSIPDIGSTVKNGNESCRFLVSDLRQIRTVEPGKICGYATIFQGDIDFLSQLEMWLATSVLGIFH